MEKQNTGAPKQIKNHEGRGGKIDMTLEAILSMAKQYLALGLILVLAVGLAAAAGYYIVYRKLMKGTRRLRAARVVWCAAFLCYLTVLLAATLLNRSDSWAGGRVMPLFYSYREAWNSFSAVQWRNLVLNILLFVPLGFLLPAGIRIFRKFWVTYLAGFLLTVLIELAQLVLGRGVVEMDDIFNNFLGTMIGFGGYAAVLCICRSVKKKKTHAVAAAAFQIPLIAAGLAFAAVIIVYSRQELGNLPSSYIVRQDMDRVRVSSDAVYSQKSGTAPVYKVSVLSRDETGAMAKEFFARLGQESDESRTDLYDETAVYYSTDNTMLWIDFSGGTFSYIDFGLLDADSQETEPDADAEESEVREAMSGYGIDLPDGMTFENQGEGQYVFAAYQQRDGDTLYNGQLSCTLYEDGRMGEIRNYIVACEKYKDMAVISEKEAYEQILDGKFRWYGEEPGELVLGDVALVYQTDSKGFYQPVYSFRIQGDTENAVLVPAVQ